MSSINLDTPEYDKLTFRMYSDAADVINLLIFYTDTSGNTGKYVKKEYAFSEENNNIGKWVEVEMDLKSAGLTNTNLLTGAQALEYIALNRGSWGVESTYNSNVYIDKIWFGESEDIYHTFQYTTSAYNNADNVGVFDTITLQFADYLGDTVACDAVSLTRGGNAVTEFEAWSDRNLLCIKTDAAMAFDSEYEITVTPALTDQRGYALYGTHKISFETKPAYLAIDEIKFVDSNGDKISSVPDPDSTISAAAEIVNGSNEAQSYIIILAMYDSDGKLLDVTISNASSYSANMVVSRPITVSNTVAEDTASVKGFL